MSSLHLNDNPTLQDFQSYVADMEKERGFTNETIPQKFLLFLEECGELAKAARKRLAMHTGAHSEQFTVEHEAADVLIYLLEICNRFDIDLEAAFRAKEEINKRRSWGEPHAGHSSQTDTPR